MSSTNSAEAITVWETIFNKALEDLGRVQIPHIVQAWSNCYARVSQSASMTVGSNLSAQRCAELLWWKVLFPREEVPVLTAWFTKHSMENVLARARNDRAVFNLLQENQLRQASSNSRAPQDGMARPNHVYEQACQDSMRLSRLIKENHTALDKLLCDNRKEQSKLNNQAPPAMPVYKHPLENRLPQLAPGQYLPRTEPLHLFVPDHVIAALQTWNCPFSCHISRDNRRLIILPGLALQNTSSSQLRAPFQSVQAVDSPTKRRRLDTEGMGMSQSQPSSHPGQFSSTNSFMPFTPRENPALRSSVTTQSRYFVGQQLGQRLSQSCAAPSNAVNQSTIHPRYAATNPYSEDTRVSQQARVDQERPGMVSGWTPINPPTPKPRVDKK